jgi:hypothetical protein
VEKLAAAVRRRNRMPAFQIDKAGIELKIGFGDFVSGGVPVRLNDRFRREAFIGPSLGKFSSPPHRSYIGAGKSAAGTPSETAASGRKTPSPLFL